MKNKDQLPDKPASENGICIRNQQVFSERIRRLNAIACTDIKREDFDIEKETEKSKCALEALNATDSLQQMLAAQMLSTHRLHQMSMAHANGSDRIENQQYFTNTAVKLANCFTQQATLLARLQGQGEQKIVVERVDVHQGGQAVVGNINGSTRACEVKK